VARGRGGDAGGARSQARVSRRDLPRGASRFHPAALAVEVAAAAAEIGSCVCSCPCDGRNPQGRNASAQRMWAAAGTMRAACFSPIYLSGLGFDVTWVGGAGSPAGWHGSPPPPCIPICHTNW
jgi:hypothetical protein